MKRPRYNRKQVLDFNWSPLQKTVFKHVLSSDRNLVIESVAGSGKTRTIEGIVATVAPGTPILVAAFNQHIALELKSRIPPSIATVSTAHGIGKMLLTRYFNGNPLKVDERKYRQICQQALNTLQPIRKQYEDHLHHTNKIDKSIFAVEPLNVIGFRPVDKIRIRALRRYLEKLVHFAQVSLCPLTIEAIDSMANYYALSPTVGRDCTAEQTAAWLYPLVIQVLTTGRRQAVQSQIISFDDLVWLPEVLNLEPPTPKAFVIADEGQDSSVAIMRLYQRMVGKVGRVILIGDRAQSVMGFAGALPEAWDQFKQELNAIECPLNICYRCPTSHLDIARFFVSQITPRPQAPVGKTLVLAFDEWLEEVKPGDLIICRFNAPLVRACLKLIHKGIKAQVRGQNIADNLINLATDVRNEHEFARHFPEQLKIHCESEIKILRADDENEAADLLKDTQEALLSCFYSFGKQCASVDQFINQIPQLFCADTDKPSVILSSIHRAKGDQAHRVTILGSNLLPYIENVKQEWQADQERNLTYVATTRSLADDLIPDSGTLFLVPLAWGDYHADWLEHPFGGMAVNAVPRLETCPNLDEVLDSYLPKNSQMSLFS